LSTLCMKSRLSPDVPKDYIKANQIMSRGELECQT
jgi:hypothetical protein